LSLKQARQLQRPLQHYCRSAGCCRSTADCVSCEWGFKWRESLFRTAATLTSTRCVAQSTTLSWASKRRSKSWRTSAATRPPTTGKRLTPWVAFFVAKDDASLTFSYERSM